jgi:hypothetical protein
LFAIGLQKIDEEPSNIEPESGQSTISGSGTVTMEISDDELNDEVRTVPIGISQMETESIDQSGSAVEGVQSSCSITTVPMGGVGEFGSLQIVLI